MQGFQKLVGIFFSVLHSQQTSLFSIDIGIFIIIHVTFFVFSRRRDFFSIIIEGILFLWCVVSMEKKSRPND